MKSLNKGQKKLLYDAMIGVGGIGSGSFFLLNGDHTLGREESRSGHFLDKNDYCKLHIIAHYVKALLSPGFQVLPVGKVGDDDIGKKLVAEMEEAGLLMDYVATDKTKHTLYSFCFLYPDKSGGNMTTDDSACSSVDSDFVSKTEKEFIKYNGRGIALAVPEVPLEARAKLLDLATKYGAFRVASFNSEEMSGIIESGILDKVDLLCINLDEAASGIKTTITDFEPEQIVERAVKIFTNINPKLSLSVTHGKDGSYVWDGMEISYLPAIKVEVVSTAGAGDAFTSGLIAGIAAGFPLKEAQQLASLAGSCSVTSPHTIHKELDRAELCKTANKSNYSFSKNILKLLEEKQ
jgi:ribokinase